MHYLTVKENVQNFISGYLPSGSYSIWDSHDHFATRPVKATGRLVYTCLEKTARITACGARSIGRGALFAKRWMLHKIDVLFHSALAIPKDIAELQQRICMANRIQTLREFKVNDRELQNIAYKCKHALIQGLKYSADAFTYGCKTSTPLDSGAFTVADATFSYAGERILQALGAANAFDEALIHEAIEKEESATATSSTPFESSSLPSLPPEKQYSVVLEHVYENSPAYLAGLREGDKITSINGTCLANSPEKTRNALIKQLNNPKKNEHIQLIITRNGHPDSINCSICAEGTYSTAVALTHSEVREAAVFSSPFNFFRDTVYITTGILDFVRSEMTIKEGDKEIEILKSNWQAHIAFLVSRELTRTSRTYLNNSVYLQCAGKALDFIIQKVSHLETLGRIIAAVFTKIYFLGSFHFFRGFLGSLPFSRVRELEFDYQACYMIANAGYDSHQPTNFYRAWSVRHPPGAITNLLTKIHLTPTPPSEDRQARTFLAAAEITERQSRGRALRPYERLLEGSSISLLTSVRKQ